MGCLFYLNVLLFCVVWTAYEDECNTHSCSLVSDSRECDDDVG